MTNNTTISVDLGKDVTYELMIEQHGGYDNAKKAYNDMREAINQVPSEHSLENKSQELKAALLAYRRVHNIFEVGDYFVLTGRYGIDTLFSVFGIGSTGLEEKYWVYSGGSWPKHCVRHATDKEIKANRRHDQ